MRKKKLIKILCASLVSAMLLTGCETVEDKYTQTNVFVEIERTSQRYDGDNVDMIVVYDRDTKVKYLIFDGYCSIAITPLYNADGTLQIYEGEEE